MLGVPEVMATLSSLLSRPRARSPFIQSIMLIVKSDGPSMSSLRIRGIVRSATGEEAALEPSNASRSSSYREVAGDVGIIRGDAPRGGEDCILLESMFGWKYSCDVYNVVVLSRVVADSTSGSTVRSVCARESQRTEMFLSLSSDVFDAAVDYAVIGARCCHESRMVRV